MSRVGAVLLAACVWMSGCTCGAPRTDIPDYTAPRVSAPTLDGRLDDAAWSSAPETEVFVRTMDGAPGDPRTTARLAWDDDALYVAFEVEDPFLRCTLTGDDPHLWEQDTVEIMIDPDGDGRNYFELQLSPTEQVFDTRYDARRVPQPFGHVDWDSGLVGATVVRGTVNDGEADEGYTAEMAIPWGAFQAGATPSSRPRPGDTWRVALYVLDVREDGARGVGWSPPMVGDFHVPDRFGRVTFGE
ncbi:MAG: carbohydrate-binding family 9-like protein [Sandaracinaceae bacterium]